MNVRGKIRFGGLSDSRMRSLGRAASFYLAILGLFWAIEVSTLGQGGSAIVLFNSNVEESKTLAEYYAAKRKVPSGQVFGFDLPKSETISRQDFQNRLKKPLLRELEKSKLITVKKKKGLLNRRSSEARSIGWSQARIRYAVLCYGMPLRIANESNLAEKEAEAMPIELRKTESAVDSELALLPIEEPNVPLAGPFPNPAFGATNVARLHPTNGVLMVSRLDGPTIEIARGLVDKAIQAEEDGLWGRAYFDARGIADGPNKLGDDWIKGAAFVTRRTGFETVLDDVDGRFPESFPMSQIAFYAGWYEYSGQVSGPFLQPEVEFMPGAFAYHLHSFSAATVRSASKNWVGPLLAKGATASMGDVFEPYLEFTPNIAMFFHRWIYMGYTFGEAAYACQSHLSWQTAVFGDPLYRPIRMPPKEQHADLVAKGSRYLEWSFLKIVNINLMTDLPIPELIGFMEQTPELKTSPVLLEKLGDLYLAEEKYQEAEAAYRHSDEVATSMQQQIRLNLNLARILAKENKPEEMFEVYESFTRQFPKYPDLKEIYTRLLDLAEELNKPEQKIRLRGELDRLLGKGF